MQNRSQTSSPKSENEKPSGPSEQPSPNNSVNQIIPSPRPSNMTSSQTPHASTDQNITIQNPPSPQNDPQKDSSSEEENQIALEVVERSRAVSFGRPQEPSYLNILQREPPRPAAIALDLDLNANVINRPARNEDIRAVEEPPSPTEAEVAQNLYVIMRKLAWFKFWRALVVYLITFAGSILLSLIKERKITSFLGVYILAYVFLIYYLAENVVKSLSQDILPWKKVENICDAIDISIVILFLLLIQLRSSGIQIPTKWVLVFYLFNMIGYFVKSTSPESQKQFQVSKRLLVGIQFSLLAFKIDENLPWPWSVTLSFVILCLIFCVICLMIILGLLLYIIISPLLNRRVFIHVARSTLILGFLWLTLHSALWGFIMTGVIALAVHIDYNDGTSDSIINNCLLATKCLGVSLIGLMIPAYNHILDHIIHFNLDKPFYEEELTPDRESGRVSKFIREKKTTYLVRLSSTYFSPLNDSFKKKSDALKKLKRAGKQARNRKFQKKLANPEDSVNQDLKLDESVSIKDLITEKLRLDKIFNKEKGNNKKDLETQINPPKGYQEREFLSDENREKPVFSMADIKKVCLSEDLEAQGLSEEVRAKSFENLCYICFEKIPDAIFAECGHGGICTHCALEIVHIKGQCMQCRGNVEKVIRIEPNAQLKDIVKGYETLTIVTNK